MQTVGPHAAAPHAAAPRSFTAYTQKYEPQWRYNEAKNAHRGTLRTGAMLRLNTESVGESAGATDSPVAVTTVRDGFYHMQRLRDALNSIDRTTWKRSYHQRWFHDHYLRACARVFFKTEEEGAFERAHKRILETNGWEALQQEVLISTPRRFGKTISISLFCAALMFACPSCECSIYSTCKRISQKLLRNVIKFLDMMYVQMQVSPYRVIRKNQEELQINGPEGPTDVRIMNSYPSKVQRTPPAHTPHTHARMHTTDALLMHY